ncbi:MAG: hypothetical protein PUK18_02160 [Firmicutes bacterium]|nr:hypothetical protein [Bacillota bacterium]MDY6160406.1 hypothetical protein [Candidatus Faecousia sp.]
MQDDPVRKLKVGGGEWDDSLRKIGHLRSKCYGRITRLIPFFRCAERYFQAFNCNSPGVSGGVSSPIKQPFQAELAYAWFVASGTVTATGMSVQAQTDAGLAIRYGAGVWGSSAAAGMSSAQSLYPTSTTDLRDWYHATANTADKAAGSDGTRTKVTGSVFPNGNYDDNSFALMREFEIRSTSNDLKVYGLSVEAIEVTAPSKTLSTALRVGVQYTYKTTVGNEEQTMYQQRIFAPVEFTVNDTANKPTRSYTVYQEDIIDEDDAKNNQYKRVKGSVVCATPNDTDAITTEHTTNSVIVPADVQIPYGATGLKVQIFVWFEGEDANLTTNNFAAETLNVTVSFTGLSTGSAG